jgi:hypothetical protein
MTGKTTWILLHFARHFKSLHLHFAKIVQDYDNEMRARFDRRVTSWVRGIES